MLVVISNTNININSNNIENWINGHEIIQLMMEMCKKKFIITKVVKCLVFICIIKKI